MGTRSPTSCWAIRPPRRWAWDAPPWMPTPIGGISTFRTVGRSTRNLKLDLGLRYEYNQNMTDANNQMSAIDHVGARRPFRHRERRLGEDFAGGERAAAVSADSLRDIRRGGVEQQPADVPASAPCSARRICLDSAGTFEHRPARGLRHLSQPGRVQHRHGLRPESAVLRDQDGEFECRGAAQLPDPECADHHQPGYSRRQRPQSQFQDRVQRSLESESRARNRPRHRSVDRLHRLAHRARRQCDGSQCS